MGDATVRTQTTYPFLQIYMTNEPFMQWLDDELEWLSTGVSLYRTAERSAALSRNNGNNPDAEASNYHDVYVMQTRTMPAFRLYENWYAEDPETGEREGKTFPNYLVLTPEIARIWYACDGSLVFDRRYPNSRPHINISVGSEMENIENVYRMFEESTFSAAPKVDDHTIRFTADETEEFLEWMGDAPPGFQYKWTDDLEVYEEQRDAVMTSTCE